MSLSIIVMGASGRMGTTIANLAKEQGMTLGGRTGTSGKAGRAGPLGMPRRNGSRSRVPAGSRGRRDRFYGTGSEPRQCPVRRQERQPYRHRDDGLHPEQKAELDAIAQNGRVFWSPNMSVGVNVLLELLPELVQMLGPDYDLEMVELHHNRKKDSPSGTALRLAESLASARDWDLKDVACYHREGIIGERPKKEIGVQAIRGGDVVGVHTVYFMGPGERIEVTHHAHSRENFAQGALRAASWLPGQPGGKVYAMGDILKSRLK